MRWGPQTRPLPTLEDWGERTTPTARHRGGSDEAQIRTTSGRPRPAARARRSREDSARTARSRPTPAAWVRQRPTRPQRPNPRRTRRRGHLAVRPTQWQQVGLGKRTCRDRHLGISQTFWRHCGRSSTPKRQPHETVRVRTGHRPCRRSRARRRAPRGPVSRGRHQSGRPRIGLTTLHTTSVDQMRNPDTSAGIVTQLVPVNVAVLRCHHRVILKDGTSNLRSGIIAEGSVRETRQTHIGAMRVRWGSRRSPFSRISRSNAAGRDPPPKAATGASGLTRVERRRRP